MKNEITCERRLTFAAGHRVFGHEGKCANLHGHNFTVVVTAKAGGLDKVGRVVDFSVLKARYGSFLETEWDHGFLLWEKDKDGIAAMKLVDRQKFVVLPFNPTSENIADHLLKMGPELMFGMGVHIVKVRVYETENCWSDAVLT